MDGKDTNTHQQQQKKRNGSFMSIFMHADRFDWLLMILGFLGAVGDGVSLPAIFLVMSKNVVAFLYIAAGQWVACFLEGYCWTRTGERQASTLRAKYLKAVLRQDVGYFDVHVTSTAEVITSVSSDSLVIQDVISEKVPVFLMNAATFIGSYIVSFALLWRLAIVGFPFVIFLVIPGLMYGRTLMIIARKMRDEYNKADTVAEQAISSIRTVYSFVGESKTISEYSSALEGTVKLGLKQGLAKGLAIGSNGIVFAIYSFMSFYGSRLVMYHGALGGTVFAASVAITIGGLSLGAGLSNLKNFSEASAAGQRMMEVINRIPKIDSENPEGQIIEAVSGEVEFKHIKFAYPSRPETLIFEDFNLSVPSGKTVALVGGSGSGKSTVVALFQRFYDPIEGQVLLDGVPIDKLQLKWLRSQMGLVSQESALFATTIKENILFGKEDASMDEVITATKASNAHSFISQLPQGYDTQNVVVFLYIAAGQWIACFLEGYCWTRTGERQASTLRAKYLKAVLRQDVGYFDVHVTSTAEVITSVSSDSLVIQDVISEKVPVFLMNAATFIGSYIVSFALLWRLAIVGFPFVIFLVIPGLMYGRTLMIIARKMRDEYNKADTVAEQAISSIRTVYSFVGESKTISEYSSALEGTVKLGLKQGLAKGLAIGSNGIVFAIYSFMSFYGSRLVMYHGALGGTVFAASVAITIGGLSLGAGLSNLKNFSEASAAGQRMMEVINRIPKIDSENPEGQIIEAVSGEVEFKHIKFAYPSRPETLIFEDFNLSVPSGKTVALVGGSGSGKSTVVALFQRFYDPIEGQVLLDDVPIDKLQLKWLRSQMGLVSQEPALFATTIKENILFGKEDASMDEVITAAKASNAHSFISQLPQGYDTQVGERGVQMSGGQKQRIAIARAIIKAPRILLLDEATSALDSESERIVQEALDQAAVGRTTIVIAHRLSTIRNADLIAVVQNGQVMEIGSHGKLIQDQNGLYTSLVRHQQTQHPNEDASFPSSSMLSSSKVDVSNTSSRRLSLVSRSSSANSVTPSQRADTGNITPPEQNFPVPSFRRLIAMNLPEWKQAIMGCTSAALFGAVQPLYAFAMGSMIFVYFLPDHNEIKEKTRNYALVFLGLAIFSIFINLCQHYSFAYMGEFLTKRIRERMLSKILTFEVGWFDRDENASGAVCSRLAKDANVVRSLVGDRSALTIQTVSAVVLAFTMGLIIAWRLAIVMIAVQPLIIFSFYWKRVMLKNMSRKAMKSQDESSKLAAEAVSNLRTVTAFSSQSRILQMLEKAQEGPRRESIRQSWFAGIGLGTSQGLTSCTWALDFWYGGKLIAQGYIGGKALFQTFMILVSTGRVIADAGTMTNDLAKGTDSIKSVFAVLDRDTLIEPEDSEGSKPEKLTGLVELHNIEFAYPARPDVVIFKGFSIRIEAGKSTALVGQSGSGKSTIIGLIERFYDPLRGLVKIDGQDVRSYSLRSLRRHIALVSQEPTLFAGSIRENIVYGASDTVDEAEIIDAAKAANAHDFVAGLKDGYDTWCGDRGVQLSGGQKQRIAIARAILKNPAILLLDEATSALDSQSEKIVQDALEHVMVGRTSVVVAHRLSTIQNCDMIAVLEKGKVVEKGTHSSLLGKGPTGAYYGLVSMQRTHSHTPT